MHNNPACQIPAEEVWRDFTAYLEHADGSSYDGECVALSQDISAIVDTLVFSNITRNVYPITHWNHGQFAHAIRATWKLACDAFDVAPDDSKRLHSLLRDLRRRLASLAEMEGSTADFYFTRQARAA